MSSRFRNLGFGGSKRKSSSPNIANTANSQQASSTTTLPAPSTLAAATAPATAPAVANEGSSSTTSLPMNHTPNGLGRPPSYTFNPNGPNGPRATSPMPPGGQQSAPHHPPPIQTGSYNQGHPALSNTAQPPQYAGGYQPAHGGAPAQYGGRGNVAEVEGAGRSKAQLIVGIDFVRRLACDFFVNKPF